MWSLVLGGLFSAFTIRREFFPEMDSDSARIALSLPGASPDEVEESLGRKVEDAVSDLDGVEKVTTILLEGGGSVIVKFEDSGDISKHLDDVRDRIELLQDLPEEADRSRVMELKAHIPVIQVTVFGEVDEETLKRSIRSVEDDLKSSPRMGSVIVSGARGYEIRIEVDHVALLRLGLPLTAVAEAVTAWMKEVPGGTIRAADGQIAVRTMGVEERADRIREIVVRADSDGRMWRLSDIATVEEGFVDDETSEKFNGAPAAKCTVYKGVGDDAIDMAQFVRGYVAGRRGEPSGAGWRESIFGGPRLEGFALGMKRGPLPVEIRAHNDLARIIDGRLNLLVDNAFQGAFLVFLTLLFGVNYRAAWWVMTGIAVAIFGTLLIMNVTGVTLNLLTMFSLLIVIGMLEDDAIVFTESIERVRVVEGLPPEEAAVRGTTKVMWPVIASVMITIVAFAPLGMVEGAMGDMLGELPIVVSIALFVSLLEAICMLPSHIAHSMMRIASGKTWWLDRALAGWDRWRDGTAWPWLERKYRLLAEWCVLHRYVTVSAAVSLLIVSLALVAGGQLPFTFLPTDDTETVVVDLRLPLGSSVERTKLVGARVEAACRSQPEVAAVTSLYGLRIDWQTAITDAASGNIAQLFIELHPIEQRDRHSNEVVDSIRRAVGGIPEVEQLTFSEVSGGPPGEDISLEVVGDNIETIREAVALIEDDLRQFKGVLAVSDDDFDAAPEIQVSIKPSAAALGLTPAIVARQIRGAIHGIDAHVHTADREDIDVRVRLDHATRTRLDLGTNMWIVAPGGTITPLCEVADAREGAGEAVVRRIDRKRAITVNADTEMGTYPELVVEALAGTLHQIATEMPGVDVRMAGKQRDRADAFSTIPYAAGAALLLIFAILAWLFGSYTQPLAVMAAIPFGIIGAIWGHIVMGYELTFLSLIGVVALSGVTVNNSLVMVEFVNAERHRHASLRDALVAAGSQRLRAILLTSITTVFGLAPLVFEQSFQARFLIPMAISLCGGLLSATFLTLLLLPSVLIIIDDTKALLRRVWGMPAPRTIATDE